jgi:hypothetical protein
LSGKIRYFCRLKTQTKKPTTRMIKTGMIGTGDMAHLHITSLLTGSNYELAGCYAPDNRQSMLFARQYRLISYSTPEALFKYADAVDITDDLPETMALAERSLKAMKHLLVAQPHRLSMAQMQYLKGLAEESGVVLQLGTGYRYCPVYGALAETMHTARMVDIRHRMVGGSDLHTRLNRELSGDFDFVTGILKASISKLDIEACTLSGNALDLLRCRIESDNGCTIQLTVSTVAEGAPGLELTFTSPEAVVRADVFKSVIDKQYRSCHVADCTVLDAYSEKAIHRQYLRNFNRAICNEPEAIHSIDELFQSMAAADYIVEHVKQLNIEN